MPKIDTHRRSMPSKPAIKRIISPPEVEKIAVIDLPPQILSPTSQKPAEIESVKHSQSLVSDATNKDISSIKASQTSTDQHQLTFDDLSHLDNSEAVQNLRQSVQQMRRKPKTTNDEKPKRNKNGVDIIPKTQEQVSLNEKESTKTEPSSPKQKMNEGPLHTKSVSGSGKNTPVNNNSQNLGSPGKQQSTDSLKQEVLEKAKQSLAEKVNVGGINSLDLKRIQDTLVNRIQGGNSSQKTHFN